MSSIYMILVISREQYKALSEENDIYKILGSRVAIPNSFAERLSKGAKSIVTCYDTCTHKPVGVCTIFQFFSMICTPMLASLCFQSLLPFCSIMFLKEDYLCLNCVSKCGAIKWWTFLPHFSNTVHP